MLSYQSGYISYLSFRQTLGLDTTRQQKYKTGLSKKGTGTASDPELPYPIRNYCNRSRITVTDPEKYRNRSGKIPFPMRKDTVTVFDPKSIPHKHCLTSLFGRRTFASPWWICCSWAWVMPAAGWGEGAGARAGSWEIQGACDIAMLTCTCNKLQCYYRYLLPSDYILCNCSGQQSLE